MNQEQQRVVADAAAAADATIAPQAARVDADAAFPAQSIAALGDRGLLGLTVPSAYGGPRYGLRTMAAAIDTVAQRCSSTAMVYLMHLCGVACYVTRQTGPSDLPCGRGGAASLHAGLQRARSRSHFWAPISRARRRTARVTV